MKALERLKNHSNNIKQFKGVSYDSEQSFLMSNYLNLAIQALEEKLDRQENKALTLGELKEMVGEPVWYKLHKSKCKDVWVSVIKEIKNDFMYFTDGTRMGFHEIVGVAQGNIVFYKHKPNGGNRENERVDKC